jgi:hypothetical protein
MNKVNYGLIPHRVYNELWDVHNNEGVDVWWENNVCYVRPFSQGTGVNREIKVLGCQNEKPGQANLAGQDQ